MILRNSEPTSIRTPFVAALLSGCALSAFPGGLVASVLARFLDTPRHPSSTVLCLAVAAATLIPLAFSRRVLRAADSVECLEATNEGFAAALANMSQGLCLYGPDGKLRLSNDRFSAMFDIPEGQVLPGLVQAEVVALSPELASEVDHATSASGMIHTPSGRSVSYTRSPMPDDGTIVTYEDVTARIEADRRVIHMARHDALTDLPNRTLFTEGLDSALRKLNSERGFSVLYLDLDRFKQVNDTMGHPAGDELLRQVALRLTECVRDRDTVARLGGDEFAILQTNTLLPSDAEALAARLVTSIAKPFVIHGITVEIGVSIGIAQAPTDGSCGERLLKNADVALYKSKSEGRGTWRFFEAAMDEAIQTRRVLETDLKAGIRRGEFRLHYQPLYDVVERRVSGAEALVRWHHPTKGMVPPSDFIAVAEDINAIQELGLFVLERACMDAATWMAEPGKGRRVAVNVSAAQLRDPLFPNLVADILARSGLPGSMLELEITETVVMRNKNSLDVLKALSALGVGLAMDDFGTGYSSLNSLHLFPFDKIKIDRSFVAALKDGEEAVRIVEAIIGLGKALGMRLTAEGIETQEDLEWLSAKGVDEAQGYLISKPVPFEDYAAAEDAWLTKTRLVSIAA